MSRFSKPLLIFLSVCIFGIVAAFLSFLGFQSFVIGRDITSNPKSNVITLAELAKHSKSDDCFVAFKEEVFNLTWFIPLHEGGLDIVQLCGQVADEFSSMHPGGPFSQFKIQLLFMISQVGVLQE